MFFIPVILSHIPKIHKNNAIYSNKLEKEGNIFALRSRPGIKLPYPLKRGLERFRESLVDIVQFLSRHGDGSTIIIEEECYVA
jgi:hypothetical protein